MVLWWRPCVILFLFFYIQAQAGKLDYPVQSSEQFYCCCYNKKGGNFFHFKTPEDNSYNLWMHLQYWPKDDEKNSGVTRIFLLVPVQRGATFDVRRGLIQLLADKLDESPAHAVGSIEEYETNAEGFLVSVNIFVWSEPDSTTGSKRALLETPIIPKLIISNTKHHETERLDLSLVSKICG